MERRKRTQNNNRGVTILTLKGLPKVAATRFKNRFNCQEMQKENKPQHPCALVALSEKAPWTMHVSAQFQGKHCMVPTSIQDAKSCRELGNMKF